MHSLQQQNSELISTKTKIPKGTHNIRRIMRKSVGEGEREELLIAWLLLMKEHLPLLLATLHHFILFYFLNSTYNYLEWPVCLSYYWLFIFSH